MLGIAQALLNNAEIEQIWGYDYMGDSETVAVHINRIRDKIEKNASAAHYIETILGAGYRFNI